MGGGDGAVIFPENIDINLCVYIFPRIFPKIPYSSTAPQKQEDRTDSRWISLVGILLFAILLVVWGDFGG